MFPLLLLELADFENKEYETSNENKRQYSNDESILVCEAGNQNYYTEIFDNLKVNYVQPFTKSFY